MLYCISKGYFQISFLPILLNFMLFSNEIYLFACSWSFYLCCCSLNSCGREVQRPRDTASELNINIIWTQWKLALQWNQGGKTMKCLLNIQWNTNNAVPLVIAVFIPGTRKGYTLHTAIVESCFTCSLCTPWKLPFSSFELSL